MHLSETTVQDDTTGVFPGSLLSSPLRSTTKVHADHLIIRIRARWSPVFYIDWGHFL
jgi:hypothetical protein